MLWQRWRLAERKTFFNVHALDFGDDQMSKKKHNFPRGDWHLNNQPSDSFFKKVTQATEGLTLAMSSYVNKVGWCVVGVFYSLRISCDSPKKRGQWLCIAGFWDLKSPPVTWDPMILMVARYLFNFILLGVFFGMPCGYLGSLDYFTPI